MLLVYCQVSIQQICVTNTLCEIKLIVSLTRNVCSIDAAFPVVTFQFENSLSLQVYPHNYLFEVRVSKLCHMIQC